MSRIFCRRCGTCCRKGGPALHADDADLVAEGHITLRDLVCIRQGEIADDPRGGGLMPIATELIKVRGRNSTWACRFFSPEESGCTIYAVRPLECRVLSCVDPSALFAAMDTPYLHRFDFVERDSALGACILEHERQFPMLPAVQLAQSYRQCQDGAVRAELLDVARREYYFRQAFADRVCAQDNDLWIYFGRPMWMVLSPLVPALKECDLW